MGGSQLFSVIGPSISVILSKLYPEYNWLPWKFENGPKNFWGDVKNQRKFMEWAGKELKIKEMSDWYNVTIHVINKPLFFLVFYI